MSHVRVTSAHHRVPHPVQWILEVEDVNIARPVDDMKKMKMFTLALAYRGEQRVMMHYGSTVSVLASNSA